MDDELRELCDLLTANLEVFNKTFKLEETMNMAGAVLFTSRHEVADSDRLKQCYAIIKSQEGILSVYRNFMGIPVVSKMALSEDPALYFEAVRTIKDELDKENFFKSEYAVIAAMIIYERVRPAEFRDYISKTKMIYKKMKDEHSVLTSMNDIVFAALLAVSNIDVDTLLLEMEENYLLIKGRIPFADSQELSHILSLDLGSPGLKAEKFLDLNQLTRKSKLSFGAGSEIYSLAALSLMELDNEQIVGYLAVMEGYLKTSRYCRGIHMFKATRLMMSAMLLIKYCRPDDEVVDNLIMYNCLSAAIAAAAAAAA